MSERSGLVLEHERQRIGLKPRFSSKQHKAVIESSADVPEMEPLFNMPLNQVGITSKKVWVNIPQGYLPFSAEVVVNLPE